MKDKNHNNIFQDDQEFLKLYLDLQQRIEAEKRCLTVLRQETNQKYGSETLARIENRQVSKYVLDQPFFVSYVNSKQDWDLQAVIYCDRDSAKFVKACNNHNYGCQTGFMNMDIEQKVKFVQEFIPEFDPSREMCEFFTEINAADGYPMLRLACYTISGKPD